MPPPPSPPPAGDPSFEDGLVRDVLVGGVLGFLLVFTLVAGMMVLVAGEGLVTAGLVAGFVGAFGGFGFGAMMGGSVHQGPR